MTRLLDAVLAGSYLVISDTAPAPDLDACEAAHHPQNGAFFPMIWGQAVPAAELGGGAIGQPSRF